jgi:hypothetical protein
LNKGARRDCSGCVYSCYYVVQNSFHPRNWRDVALLWWDTRTEPGSAERKTADRFGWLAGLFSLMLPRVAQRVSAVLISLALLLLPLALALRAATPAPELSPSQLLGCFARADALGRQAPPATPHRAENPQGA